MEPQPRDGSRRAVRAGLAGFGAVAAYALVGTLQLLVWEPQAAVPGASLEQIRAGVERAGESLGVPIVIGWAVVGTVLAAAVLAGTLAGRVRAYPAAMLHLLLVVLAAPSYFYVSFAPGMAVADTYGTTGADHAPWGMVLYGTSVAALAVLLIVAVSTARRRGA
ncbi:hypothetical protein [Zhihengliuella salsuginis]|uniref:Uncharacterized protein n=1 Tax=Zhihengliuella salsuginis TaxID=578222 RepID=A0ABQ3GLS8_9MICC|nr:hypothetical protein [Zhihengliuella salsuginis]GHD09341.1 hypothetical protein GCM10008096_21900 [Zhihengliuella salsuginis]